MENVTRKLLEKALSASVLKCELISLYKVLTNLCNNHELLRLIRLCGFENDFRKMIGIRLGRAYENVEAKAIELLSEMSYQVSSSYHYRRMLLEFLWPVVYKILLWKSVYAPSIGDVFLQHFYWTNRGTIDNIKTARQIIKNQIIPIRKRFMLACRLCLYEEIQKVWEEMSDDDKTEITGDNREPLFHLLQFWKNKLREQLELAEREFAERELAEMGLEELGLQDLELQELKVEELELQELEVEEMELQELDVEEMEFQELGVEEMELQELEVEELHREDLQREELDNVLKCAVEFGSLEAVKNLFRMMDENEKSDNAVLCYNLVREKLRRFLLWKKRKLKKVTIFSHKCLSQSNLIC